MRTVEEIKGKLELAQKEDSADGVAAWTVELFKTITDGILLDRLEEICNAERDGRCLTPPCKLGDTAYWISNFVFGIREAPITAIRISGFGFDLNLSRSPAESTWREAEKCYFTREAAEAALKERE